MKGWCPLDDRVVASRNRRCPECGTPLVVVAAPAKLAVPSLAAPGASVEAVAAPIRSRVVAALLTALAVAAAGVVAVELSRGGEDVLEESPALFSLLDVEVGDTQTDAGIRVRLEHVSQRADRLIASFAIVEGFRTGIPRAAALEVVQGEQLDYARTFALGPVTTLNNQRGFVIEADLPLADQPALALRITGFEISLLERAPDGSSVATVPGSWRWSLRP